MKRLVGRIVLMLLVATPTFGQESDQAREKEQARPAGESQPATPKPSASPSEQPRSTEGQTANVRIELTITDQRGDAAPVTKTVSMITADRTASRVRTRGDVMTPNMGPRAVVLNVDAHPTILPRDKVRVMLTIEYQLPGEAGSDKAASPSVSESLSVILEDGKPLLISQSADPLTDRKVKVEAKVTIVR